MTTRCIRCGYPLKTEGATLCPNCQKLDANPDELSKRKSIGNVPFVDMQKLSEEDRISHIAKIISESPGRGIMIMVDCGEGYEDKGDRYIRGIREKVPGVKLQDRRPGPTANVETLIFTKDK